MVTAYDPDRVLFVQDASGGVFVYHTGARLPIRPKQSVQVTGVAAQGHYSPFIHTPIVRALETSVNVEPKRVSLAQLQRGGCDAQWVETTGNVRSSKITDGRLSLELADPPYRLTVWIPEFAGHEFLPLLHSDVRIRGVVGIAQTPRGELAGFQLFANALSDIIVLRPALDPGSLPLSSVANLKSNHVRTGEPKAVRVRGVVSLSRANAMVFIQDSTGGLELSTISTHSNLPPGTVIEVLGYPGDLMGPARLEDVTLRILGTNAPPKPLRATADDLQLSRHDNELLELEADFLGLAESPSSGVELMLQTERGFLQAKLDAGAASPLLGDLKPGTRLRLTGVSHTRTTSGGEAAVALLLRSLQDLVVISRPVVPPALTPGRLALAAGVIGALVIIAWWLLRRQRLRTEHILELQATLQSEMRQRDQQLRRVMQDRERIARDLHDDIIQSIYAAGLRLEDCRRLVRPSPEEVESRLKAVVQTLNDTIKSVRGFIAGLEPKALNGRELKTALKSLALTSGEGPTQFQFHVDQTGANHLTSNQATQLLHIAKEAMTNSLRHARAANITVSLQPHENAIRLEITDDGIGFVPGEEGATGQGLRNIAARTRDLGGTMETFSSPGQGCRILITVPQRNNHESD